MEFANAVKMLLVKTVIAVHQTIMALVRVKVVNLVIVALHPKVVNVLTRTVAVFANQESKEELATGVRLDTGITDPTVVPVSLLLFHQNIE